MPSTYAHYRFGNDVRNRLPERQKKEIEAYFDLFSIGLHGPDLLFYYRPLSSNAVNQTGYDMHDLPGIDFFAHAGEILRQYQFSPEYAAYIYGFLCHFALDRECHGYIDEKIEASGASHSEIEVEFDRALLVEDGYDPLSKKLTDHIHPSREASLVISRFFPGISDKEIYKASRSMVFYCDLLCAPGKGKRNLLLGLLKLAGKYESMKDLMIRRKPDPICSDSCARLRELYDSALEKAVRLILEFPDSASGKIPYDPLYRYTFGSLIPDDKELSK